MFDLYEFEESLEAGEALFETPEPGWVEWQASPYHSSRGGQSITAIIYHFTAGPRLEGTVRWFRSNPKKVSAHYVIGKDGRIVQMVALDRAAHHAGRGQLAGCRRSVNACSVGIEIVNWGKLRRSGSGYLTHSGRRYTGPQPVRARNGYWEPFTASQYEALIRLTRFLLSRYPGITHITGHEDIAIPRGRKNDPGGGFDWARIRTALASFRGHIGPISAPSGGGGATTAQPILRRGARGDAVRRLQELLNRWIARTPGAGVAILVADGIFGQVTQAAVRAFQRANSLSVDGVVGSQTWGALNRLPGGGPPAPAPGRFRLVPVENPGGGRVTDKRDPAPGDVVTVSGTGGRKIPLHKLAAQAWQAMVSAARADGIAAPLLLPTSGYRSSAHQARLWADALKKYGSPQEARKWVAPPGGSAHQSGRAIDLYLGGSNSSGNVDNLRRTAAYRWLERNATRFGFYPYTREPWHWEYNPPSGAREFMGEYEGEYENGC